MKHFRLLACCLLFAISIAAVTPLAVNAIELSQWGGGPLIQIYAPIQAPKIFALRIVGNIYWLAPGVIFGLLSARPALQSGAHLGVAFAIASLVIDIVHAGFPRYAAIHFLSPTLTSDILTSLQYIFLFELSTVFGSSLRHHRSAPNSSFKPSPLRSGNDVAG